MSQLIFQNQQKLYFKTRKFLSFEINLKAFFSKLMCFIFRICLEEKEKHAWKIVHASRQILCLTSPPTKCSSGFSSN